MQAVAFMAPPQPHAGLDVDVENALSRCACHRRSPLCWCCQFISHPDLVALPVCRRDQRPVPTVECEHPVEAG